LFASTIQNEGYGCGLYMSTSSCNFGIVILDNSIPRYKYLIFTIEDEIVLAS